MRIRLPEDRLLDAHAGYFGLEHHGIVDYPLYAHCYTRSALPALIAIGYVRHVSRPSLNLLARIARKLVSSRALQIAERMQPENGGYEEATPLTGFVTMSLASAGERDCLVVKRAADFLVKSMRPDGSWPIDTNLATWVTTLSVKALSRSNEEALSTEQKERIREWLLEQQHDQQHEQQRCR